MVPSAGLCRRWLRGFSFVVIIPRRRNVSTGDTSGTAQRTADSTDLGMYGSEPVPQVHAEEPAQDMGVLSFFIAFSNLVGVRPRVVPALPFKFFFCPVRLRV